MPSKIFCRIFRGSVSHRHKQDERNNRDKLVQLPYQPSADCLELKTGSTSVNSNAASSRLISKLTRRFSSTNQAISISTSFRKSRGPHLPQEPLVESWMQPELQEFRQADDTSSEHASLLMPLQPLRRLCTTSCQATAVSEPFRDDIYGTAVHSTELLLAKTFDWLGQPDTSVSGWPACHIVDSGGDGCECFSENIWDSSEECAEVSEISDSLVSDCVLRLCMTSPESLRHNLNHSNYSDNQKRCARLDRSNLRQRQRQLDFDQNRHHCNKNHGDTRQHPYHRCEDFDGLRNQYFVPQRRW